MNFNSGKYRRTALVLLALGWSGVRGQDVPRPEAVAVPSRITVGDLIAYRITVQAAPGSQVGFKIPGEALGPFEVREFHVLDPVEQEGKKTFAAEATLSIFQTGEFKIPSPEVVYWPADGAPPSPLQAPEAEIVVDSVKPADASDIRDIKPPLEIPRAWWSYWPWALLAGILAAAAYGLMRGKKPKPDAEPIRPRLSPYAEAYQALCHLRDRGLPDRPGAKSYYTELSEITRRYLQRRFDVPAMESTSAEIRSQLDRVEIRAPARDRVDQLLALCDLVKFAKHDPAPESSRAALENAFQILEETRPEVPKAAVAAPGPTRIAAD